MPYDPLCEECDTPLRRGEHDLCNHCERRAEAAEERYTRQEIGD